MHISHQRLEGQIVKLKKPFAVLQKKKTTEETAHEIVAIIRQKYLFSTRPQPIVNEEFKGKATRIISFFIFI